MTADARECGNDNGSISHLGGTRYRYRLQQPQPEGTVANAAFVAAAFAFADAHKSGAENRESRSLPPDFDAAVQK